jgi:hypothetical protein
LPGAIAPKLAKFDGLDPERRPVLDAEAAISPLDDAMAFAISVLDRHYPSASTP